MSVDLILAYDLGTSGIKACIFDSRGNFLGDAYGKCETEYPHAGWAVQDPERWWTVLQAATRQAVEASGAGPERIRAISFSSHGGALVPVDREGRVLMDRVMLWNDARCGVEAKYILAEAGAEEHYRKTGCSMDLSMSIAAKLLWMRRYMPETYEKTYKFLGAKEYMILRMTGEMGYTDFAERGSSGAFNNETCSWDPELLRICRLDPEKLCEAASPTKVVGGLTRAAAAYLGLCPDTPVVLGSWDNYACASGGGIHSGEMVLCMGTAGWFGVNSGKPLALAGCKPNIVHVDEGTFFTSIHSHSACAAYDWVRHTMCSYLEREADPLRAAEELARRAGAGAGKLFFLPAMFTGNTFYSSNALCGSMLGLKMGQDCGHIIRAAMEGPAFDLMIGAELLREQNMLPERCTVIGGGAKSSLWVQILADMFDMPVRRPRSPQHIGALGAALYAGVGAGSIRSLDEAAGMVQTEDVTYPDPANHKIYQELLPVYQHFYEKLMPVYEKLQAVALQEKRVGGNYD